MRRGVGPVLAVLAAGCSGDAPPTDPGPGPDAGVTLRPVAQGLASPVLVTAPPGDPRLFIVEQAGRVWIVQAGLLQPDPFLDIRHMVGSGGERGLLGLAFDPDFATNRRFFVSYTDLDGDSRIEGWRADEARRYAEPGSRHTFLRLDQPFGNHNGGHLAYGPDGMLYAAFGDGGSGGDPLGAGQDRSTLLGTIIRVDPRFGFEPPWEIPPDNPFVGVAGARPEIWHWGLRNPWRFAFDRASRTMVVADVGQDRWEEIDVVPDVEGGHNFGWSTMEGAECFGAATCDASGLTLPVVVYGHDEGCSVTGGVVYRGRDLPALDGHYLYADYCEGWIRAFPVEDPDPTPVRLDVPFVGSITSFGEDADGEVYVTTQGGEVHRLAPAGS